MSPLLNSKNFLFLILLPSIFQVIFQKLWIDPFLIILFYLAWDTTIFPAFIFIVIWSIIKYYIVGENIGVEVLSLTAVWYALNFFSFETRKNKIIGIVIGSFIFIFINIFIPHIKGIWSTLMVLKFLAYFTCINLIFCWLIWSIRMLLYPQWENGR